MFAATLAIVNLAYSNSNFQPPSYPVAGAIFYVASSLLVLLDLVASKESIFGFNSSPEERSVEQLPFPRRVTYQLPGMYILVYYVPKSGARHTPAHALVF